MSETARTRLTLATWNMQNNGDLPQHMWQNKRKPGIVAQLSKLAQLEHPVRISLCEAVSAQYLADMVGESGLILAGRPHLATHDEWMGFAINAAMETAAGISSANKLTTEALAPGAIALSGLGFKSIAVHYPYQVWRSRDARSEMNDLIMDAIDPENEPTVVEGDFNNLHWQKARRQLVDDAHLTELHALDRPNCPTPAMRGVSRSKWLPSGNVDGMYVSDHFTFDPKDQYYIDTIYSDHAILVGNVEAELETLRLAA